MDILASGPDEYLSKGYLTRYDLSDFACVRRSVVEASLNRPKTLLRLVPDGVDEEGEGRRQIYKITITSSFHYLRKRIEHLTREQQLWRQYVDENDLDGEWKEFKKDRRPILYRK